jgi:hypothetical protein
MAKSGPNPSFFVVLFLFGFVTPAINGHRSATSLDKKTAVSSPRPKVWLSQPPTNCPFSKSREIVDVAFTGIYGDYHAGDTWYPCWASDGNLYSPWTDGSTEGVKCDSYGEHPATGQAIVFGDDPRHLKIQVLGTTEGSPKPYAGRYPCGSLVYNGVWYYGTYCLSPDGKTRYGDIDYNWPWLGPFVGFRISMDFGKTWQDCPHTPAKSLFGETGLWGHPVKIGAPHFVDFGRNMEHSPDGKAYLVAHGAVDPDPKPRFANLSWISGDQIYLLRVTPKIENMNNASKYEFYGGKDKRGKPLWTNDFNEIQPLVDWNNNCGCVTATYNAPLKKYLMCVTDGWPTYAKMNSYILEADQITGPWRMVTYMKNFGEQAYFLNFPSKFISADGRTAWLCYSTNFSPGWNGVKMEVNPTGGHYGMVLQELKLLSASEAASLRKGTATAK